MAKPPSASATPPSPCLSPRRRRAAVALALLVGVASGAAPSPAAADRPPSKPPAEQIGTIQVLMSPSRALAEAFPEAERVEVAHLAVDDSPRTALAAGEGGFAADSVAVYIARGPADSIQGYAVIGEEIGKYRPITFMVATDPRLRVLRVAVLVYRESRGGQVRRTRFLRQYRGKDLTDPIRIHRDIVNITGATLSVRALNEGVRKALQFLDAVVRSRAGVAGVAAGP